MFSDVLGMISHILLDDDDDDDESVQKLESIILSVLLPAGQV